MKINLINKCAFFALLFMAVTVTGLQAQADSISSEATSSQILLKSNLGKFRLIQVGDDFLLTKRKQISLQDTLTLMVGDGLNWKSGEDGLSNAYFITPHKKEGKAELRLQLRTRIIKIRNLKEPRPDGWFQKGVNSFAATVHPIVTHLQFDAAFPLDFSIVQEKSLPSKYSTSLDYHMNLYDIGIRLENFGFGNSFLARGGVGTGLIGSFLSDSTLQKIEGKQFFSRNRTDLLSIVAGRNFFDGQQRSVLGFSSTLNFPSIVREKKKGKNAGAVKVHDFSLRVDYNFLSGDMLSFKQRGLFISYQKTGKKLKTAPPLILGVYGNKTGNLKYQNVFFLGTSIRFDGALWKK